VLQPRRKEAEHTSSSLKTERQTFGKHPAEHDFPETAFTALEISDGGFAAYEPINLAHVDGLTLRVKPEGSANLEVRLGGPEGQILGEKSFDVSAPVEKETAAAEPIHDLALAELPEQVRKAYEGWHEITLSVDEHGDAQTLVFVIHGSNVQIDWMEFSGPGAHAGPGQGRTH
jgi:hypothetical protein